MSLDNDLLSTKMNGQHEQEQADEGERGDNDIKQETHLEPSKSAIEIADLIAQQQKLTLSKSNENLIITNFVSFFEPLVQNLDANVQSLRFSQIELQNQIKQLLNQISKIYDDEKKKLDLDEYTKRLVHTKKRLNTIQATIIAVQERLNRIYLNIQKDNYLKQQKQLQQQQQQQSEIQSQQ